jgi:hypothetical protein
MSRSAIVACLAGLVLVVLANPAVVAQGASAATAAGSPAYTAWDVGFAEGARPNDGDLARRLDGIVAYVPGRSPFIRLDLDWWYVQDCRTCSLRWDNLDPVVDQAAARGVRVLLVLAYAPPWANGGHATDKWLPAHDADWTTIVDRTVQHFGSRGAGI